MYYHAPYTCSLSISTGRSSPVFYRLDFLSNQVAFPSWFASDTCKGYHFQTTSFSSVEVEQLLWIVSTPPEVTVILLLSCESPLRLNKALPSLKKLGPCARTRTRTAQVVPKASLSLTGCLGGNGSRVDGILCTPSTSSFLRALMGHVSLSFAEETSSFCLKFLSFGLT